jgi:uncharacterized protein YbjT (DUF2867 family)
MTTPILLTGGTGTLGRLVTPRLRDAGLTVRVLSRRRNESEDGVEFVTGDLATGEGVEAAVNGVGTIVHLAGSARGDHEATRNLVRAASRAGVQHLVYISVIGADRVPLGWFRSKRGAGRVRVRPAATTLRAAQFHDLVLTLVQKMAKLPVIPVPGGLRFQPVDPDEVSARLVELPLDKPAGLVPDLAGLRIHQMADLIRGYLRARGKRRLMLPVRMPGKAGRTYLAGENLSLEGADVGKRTWDDFLIERLR